MSQEFLEMKNEKNRIKKRLENYDPNPLIISLDNDQPFLMEHVILITDNISTMNCGLVQNFENFPLYIKCCK